MENETLTLNELARMLFRAKQAENKAKAERVKVEEQIAALVTIEVDRGSKTEDAGDGMRVTVERKMNYKADVAAIKKLDVPDESVLPLKWVPGEWVFDPSTYEKLRKEQPDFAARMAGAITATPAKVAVTLKLA